MLSSGGLVSSTDVTLAIGPGFIRAASDDTWSGAWDRANLRQHTQALAPSEDHTPESGFPHAMPSRSRARTLSLDGSGNDPLSTSFVIADELMFQVGTGPLTANSQLTSIRTAKDVTIAEIVWAIDPKDTRVTFHGVGMSLNEFLRQDASMITSRIFKCTNGKRYKWKEQLGKDNLILVDAASKQRIAESHGYPTLGINIFTAGRELIDAIVVTFLIMERLKQERRRRDRTLNRRRKTASERRGSISARRRGEVPGLLEILE